MNGAELLVRALENEGVQYVFGIPGEENLDFLEALRTSTIKLIVTRHEQSAGFMAATIGRLTGAPAVALSTLGPGATNLVTPAAYATLGAMPMIMITGQKPIKTSKQGQFQIINVVDMMKPVTKYAVQVTHANKIPQIVREATRRAIEERPGAVHIELPEDIAGEIVDEADLFPTQKVRRPIAEQKAVSTLVELLVNAKSPLLLIGAGANRKITSKMLTEFIELTGIPFFTTQMGKGVVSDELPSHIGCAALSSSDFMHKAVEDADLIINVGHDVIEKPPFFMKQGGAKVAHVNFYGAHVDSIYFPQHEVIGDIANAIWQVTEALRARKPEWKDHWDFSSFYALKTRFYDHLEEKMRDGSFPLLPQRIVADIRNALPSNGIVALDNGMYKLWFARYYSTFEPNTLLLDNALATMGAGLPSGMAAKLIYPDRKVVVVAGDGGFMMNSQELETAVRLELDLVIVIINDSGYGMIKWKQDAQNLPSFGLDYTNPDFVKYAESYGAKGYRVTNADEFGTILTTALNSKGVHVIDTPIDYSENARVFNDELKRLTS